MSALHPRPLAAVIALAALQLVSYKVLDRALAHSASEKSDRLALVAVAHLAHHDGVLADPRIGPDELAGLAAVSGRQLKRSLTSLCEAGELAYLRATGRGRYGVLAVLAGAEGSELDAVWRAFYGRGFELGGRFDLVTAETSRDWEKGVAAVTLYGGRKGDSSDRKGANPSRKGDSSDTLFSYVCIPRVQGIKENNNTARMSGGGDGSAGSPPSSGPPSSTAPSAGPLAPNEARARDGLLALGVYEIPAERIARMEPAWVRRVLAAGRAMQARGQTKALGAVVVAMADGRQPLPELDVSPPPVARRPDQVLHELPPELQERYDEITTSGGDWHADAELNSALTDLLTAAAPTTAL